MRKKILALIICFSFVSSMVACSNKSEENNVSNSEVTSTETSVAENESTSGLKVGFIFLHDENSTYDLNFINAAKNACIKNGVEYELRTGVDESEKCYETASELAKSGCDIVFADSFGHEQYMVQAAKEYPDTEFCHATGTRAHTEQLPNYHNAFATIYDGRYISGVIAGMKLNEMISSGKISKEEAVVGYIGAFTYAEVISGYTAFYLGVKSVCDSATMKVTFTGSWYDEASERVGAQKLLDEGCVLISQHADSIGAPALCEANGIPNISYNGSNQSACPDTFMVASRINWEPYFDYIINCVQNGESFDYDWTGTLETGSVQITAVGHNAPDGASEKIQEIENELINGQIKVFDTTKFTVNGQYLSESMADVDTDENYTPDTEVISDGEFHESEYRSAPYFDLQIDGIELLDVAY